MAFEITVKDHIASAHQLHGYQGPCAQLHGHTWHIEVVIIGHDLDAIGLVVDFKDLKKKLKEVIMPLDHVCLNDLPAFKGINPSTENLARHIYRDLKNRVLPLTLKHVRVWESESASVIYYE